MKSLFKKIVAITTLISIALMATSCDMFVGTKVSDDDFINALEDVLGAEETDDIENVFTANEASISVYQSIDGDEMCEPFTNFLSYSDLDSAVVCVQTTNVGFDDEMKTFYGFVEEDGGLVAMRLIFADNGAAKDFYSDAYDYFESSNDYDYLKWTNAYMYAHLDNVSRDANVAATINGDVVVLIYSIEYTNKEVGQGMEEYDYTDNFEDLVGALGMHSPSEE